MLKLIAQTTVKHYSAIDTVDPILSNFSGLRRMVHDTKSHRKNVLVVRLYEYKSVMLMETHFVLRLINFSTVYHV